ncbi:MULTISPECIES: hypothetical protein [Nocardia]|uniref:hypothetical protein n=1 Tax=Nocardia TaxID=1817 RepID=UPI000D68FA15|nr:MULTISPECIES: hypothetical protein [Nocardia]
MKGIYLVDDYLVTDTGVCNCAYPDCGGYCMHEPHCGLEPVGEVGFDVNLTTLWDFTEGLP